MGEQACGVDEMRQPADMRSSGAIEGDAGGDQSNKMANSIATNKRLRKTYSPVDVARAPF